MPQEIEHKKGLVLGKGKLPEEQAPQAMPTLKPPKLITPEVVQSFRVIFILFSTFNHKYALKTISKINFVFVFFLFDFCKLFFFVHFYIQICSQNTTTYTHNKQPHSYYTLLMYIWFV